MAVKLPTARLGYSALLSLDTGASTGSGFQLSHNLQKVLVTAKHVLFNRKDEIRCESLVISFQTPKGQETDIEIIGIENIADANIVFSVQNDLALILLAERESLETPFEYKEYVNIYQNGNVDNAFIDSSETRLLDQIGVGNDVFLLGYPTSLFFQSVKHFDIRKPLLRKGIIAGLNVGDNTFIIDCPAYYGNSGAPVIEVCEDDSFKVVGLVSRYVPFVVEWKNSRESVTNTEYLNSGYSVCVPMDVVYDLIDQL
jgi:hypothetical protein